VSPPAIPTDSMPMLGASDVWKQNGRTSGRSPELRPVGVYDLWVGRVSGHAGVAIDPEKQVHGGLIRRGKWITFQFLRCHPAKIIDPHRSRFLRGRDGGPIENQVNDIAIVTVAAVDERASHHHVNANAPSQFSLERLRVGLACLYFATRELPYSGQYRCRAWLRDEISTLLLDYGTHNTDAGYDVACRLASNRSFHSARFDSQPHILFLEY
jgi:hypothetical protein